MRRGQSKHPRHVFAGDFLQHAQRHDRALQLPQMIEAPDHERVLLRLGDQLVDRQRVLGQQSQGLVARFVRSGDIMPAAPIARVIPREDREELEGSLFRFDQLSSLWQQEERVKRVLNAVERILVPQPLAPSQTEESSSVGVDEP